MSEGSKTTSRHDRSKGPKDEEVAASLSKHIGYVVRKSDIVNVSDLSPGLSSSRVFRVTFSRCGSNFSLILKIPNWGSSSTLSVSDPLVPKRELLFFQSELPSFLDNRIAVPDVIGLETCHEKTWIWMNDDYEAFKIAWRHQSAFAAAKAIAGLHTTYQRYQRELESFGWLAREPYRMFEGHRDEANENLLHIARYPKAFPQLSPEAIETLKGCLTEYEALLAQLRRMPLSLVHGDFHPRNIGFLPDDRMLLIDWCQTGLGPLGSDLAIFISLYGLFSGVRECRSANFERSLISAYHKQLCLPPSMSVSPTEIEWVVWLWAATWGLHLRLGPGLSAVFAGKIQSPEALFATIHDIVSGCDRVTEQAHRFLS